MFFIKVFFENNTIIFSYGMDFSKVQKNENCFFDENIKFKNYIVRENHDINFEQIKNDFTNFKKKYSELFLIDDFKEEPLEFMLFDDAFDDMDKIINFIEKNGTLNITLHLKNYKEFITKSQGKDFPNLKIKFENSESKISFKKFKEMYIKLNEIIEFINHYDLSQLEKVFLVYDIVKSNVYKKENPDDPYCKSRDLNEIINNDKIVCVGFANLINYLLTNLGIKNKCITTINKKTNVGHRKNYIYIDDKKYNIQGVFFLDVTADSKKDDNYLDNYRYFLKSFDFFNSKNYEIVRPNSLTLLLENEEDIFENIENGSKIYLSYLLTLLNFIDIQYSLINTLYQISIDKNKLKEIIKLAKEKYNPRNIDEETFKTVLYKVRRIEYINNIVKREINEEYIDEVYNKNYGIENALYSLLAAIGVYENKCVNTELANIDNLDLDNLRMRLLKDLKLILNDIPNNEFIKKM